MKAKLLILIMGMFLLNSAAWAQDSTTIPIGNKGWNFRLDYIPFGAIIGASSPNSKSQLEAKPFIGSGFSGTFSRTKYWGLSISLLFYTNDSKTMYPLAGGGFVLFPTDRVAASLMWDCGKIDGVLKHQWQERLKFLVNYNLNLVK